MADILFMLLTDTRNAEHPIILLQLKMKLKLTIVMNSNLKYKYDFAYLNNYVNSVKENC